MRYGRNGRYARQISKNINSGIYLGPTRGLSSPKNNRRACLCLDKDTYSRDCCNGALQQQGIGVIQGSITSTTTSTTTSGPTTTSTTSTSTTSTTTAAPTTTTTSTTSTSTTTLAPTTTTSTSTTSTTTAAPTTTTSTSTTTLAPTTTTSTTTAAPTTTTSTSTTSTTSTTTAAPLPIVTSSLALWTSLSTFVPGASSWLDSSGNGNTALVSGSSLALSGSFGVNFTGTSEDGGGNNFLTYPATLNGGDPTTQWTVQFYGTWDINFRNLDFFTHNDYTNGWDIALTPDGRTVWRSGGAGVDFSWTLPKNTLGLVTFTANASTNLVQLYYNTTLIDETSLVTVGNWNITSVPMTFGWNANTDASYFKGTVKQLTLYKKILSIGEITTNYNAFIAL